MATYAVTDSEGVIINVIEWDGVSQWTPPTNCQVRPLTEDDIFNG